MSERKIPEKVLDAIARDDHETLRVLGAAGGRASQRARRIQKTRKQTMALRDVWQKLIQANEHIVGADGESGPCPDGVIMF